MKFRRTLIGLFTGGAFFFAPFNSDAAPLGIANSPQSFDIVKSASDTTISQITSSLIEPGDMVRALTSRVKLVLEQGSEILLDKQSVARVTERKSVEFNSGRMLAHSKPDHPVSVTYEGLGFAPGEGGQESILHFEKLGEGLLEVTGIEGVHLVKVLETGMQKAIVGAGDRIRFQRTSDGWDILPSNPLRPAAQSPIRGNRQLQTGAINGAPVQILPVWWTTAAGVAGGGAAAAGGTALLINELDDDDPPADDDEPLSPVF